MYISHVHWLVNCSSTDMFNDGIWARPLLLWRSGDLTVEIFTWFQWRTRGGAGGHRLPPGMPPGHPPVYTFLKKHHNINFLNTSLHKFPYNFYYWLRVLLKLSKYIYKKNAKNSNLYIINIFIYSMCVMCMNVSYPKVLALKTHFIKYKYLLLYHIW